MGNDRDGWTNEDGGRLSRRRSSTPYPAPAKVKATADPFGHGVPTGDSPQSTLLESRHGRSQWSLPGPVVNGEWSTSLTSDATCKSENHLRSEEMSFNSVSQSGDSFVGREPMTSPIDPEFADSVLAHMSPTRQRAPSIPQNRLGGHYRSPSFQAPDARVDHDFQTTRIASPTKRHTKSSSASRRRSYFESALEDVHLRSPLTHQGTDTISGVRESSRETETLMTGMTEDPSVPCATSRSPSFGNSEI